MDPQCWERLKRNWDDLTAIHLKDNDILDFLFSKGVISWEERYSTGKMKDLLHILREKPGFVGAYGVFMEALKEAYEHLAIQIEKTKVTTDPSVKAKGDPAFAEPRVREILLQEFKQVKGQKIELSAIKDVLLEKKAFGDLTWSNKYLQDYLPTLFNGIRFEKQPHKVVYVKSLCRLTEAGDVANVGASSTDAISDDEMTGTLAKTGDRANDDDLFGDRVKVVVEKCSQKFFRNHRADSYRMERNPRGLALIVNVFEAKGRKPRRGTNFDRDNLKDLLTQLYFDVTIYNDTDGLSAGEITAKVREFSTDTRHARSDACIVCMLSHGDEGHIAGNDGEKVELSEIFAMFNNHNCKDLIDKPKLFIIQACRGGLAEGVVRTVEVDDASEDIEEPEDLVSTSDVLKCFPTQAFYQSFRDPLNGSWFIEAIVKVFMKYAKSEDVCTMMNRVNFIISNKVGKQTRRKKGKILEAKRMQMSEYTSSLRKPHLYFFPGISSPNSS